MNSVAKATQLSEITVDGNPVSLGGDCVSFLVSHLPNLKLLSCMEVTEPVRKAALAWRSTSHRREEVISNARTNWELLRSQTHCLSTASGSLKDLRNEPDLELANDRCVQSDSGVSSATT